MGTFGVIFLPDFCEGKERSLAQFAVREVRGAIPVEHTAPSWAAPSLKRRQKVLPEGLGQFFLR